MTAQTMPNPQVHAAIRDQSDVSWSILGGTRFALALIVLNYHMYSLFGIKGLPEGVAQWGGKAAVIGFLAISGFSIHASLKKDVSNFLKRRFLRVYPAYAVAILLSYALRCVPNAYGLSIDSKAIYLCNALMLQMFVCKAIDYDLAVWSLSVEFSFYVFIYLFRFMGLRTTLIVALISIIFFCLPEHLSDSRAYVLALKFKPTKYIWPFLFGYVLFERRSKAWFMGLGAAGVVCTMLSREIPRTESLSGLTILLSFAAIWTSVRWPGMRSSVLLYAGDLSYPVYLFHILVMIALGHALSMLTPSVIILACISVSVLAMHGAERQIRIGLCRIEAKMYHRSASA